MAYLNNPRQQGFSLIEVMIAVVIGIALLGGAVNIFISNNNVYRLETQLSRMQETGRFLIDTIAKEIRMAGFIGCGHRQLIEPNTLVADPPFAIEDENSIRGFEFEGTTWNPALPDFITASSDINATVLPYTDVIAIQRGDTCSATLANDLLTFGDEVELISNDCNFQENQIVIITDCADTADVFMINNDPSGNSLAHAEALSKKYRSNDGSQVLKYLTNVFYIEENTNREPSAWLASWDPAAAARGESDARGDYMIFELADGVERMHILYGIDTNDDQYVDEYVTANNVTDWGTVSSARVNVLVRSDNNITLEARPFQFDGEDVNTDNDTRLRLAFSATVTLRNRLP